MITPAVTYFRVSTDDQGKDGFGMQAQQGDVCLLRRVIDFFVAREFFEVDSGKNDKRPILKSALRYCKKIGAILIIAKIDRLARHAFFVARLLESPVKIIAADKPNATKLQLLEDAIEAEKEGDIISKRTSSAMQAAKRRGIRFGVACKDLAQKNKQAADDFAKKMIPIIEELIAQGFKTIRALAAELNRRHIHTFRRHRAKWHRNTVYNLLNRIKELSINDDTPSFTETSNSC